jgi:hypothetical protein
LFPASDHEVLQISGKINGVKIRRTRHELNKEVKETGTFLQVDVALGARPDQARGPGVGQAAQTMFETGPGSSLVQMTAIKRHIENFGLYWPLFLRKKVLVALPLWLRHSRAPDTNSTDFNFLGFS